MIVSHLILSIRKLDFRIGTIFYWVSFKWTHKIYFWKFTFHFLNKKRCLTIFHIIMRKVKKYVIFATQTYQGKILFCPCNKLLKSPVNNSIVAKLNYQVCLACKVYLKGPLIGTYLCYENVKVWNIDFKGLVPVTLLI